MMMGMLKVLSAVAVLLTAGSTFAIETYPLAAHAQTQGMTRRGERRDTRQTSRDVKHECNAHGANSRAECRHQKHSVKHEGRTNGTPTIVTPH
jgi:hypothetical protein